MSDRLPSLSDFATGNRSAYPELWENCIGAWAPSLGPTGGIIPDRTDLTVPAEVINPTLATNYAVSDGIYAFDANQSQTTYVKTGLGRANTVTQLTWAWWGRLHPGGAFYVSDLSSSRGFGVDNLATLIYLNYPGAANYAQIVINTTGGWFHFAYVFDGNGATDAERIKLYINGTERALTYVGATPTSLSTTTEPLQIGRRPYAVTITPGLWDDFRAYSVALDPSRIRLLASQRGIAYTPRKRRFAVNEFVPEPPPSPVTGGGGPGGARRRQRPMYMVDDKVFDSPSAAARYLASVTLPEPAPEAPRAAPRPKPKLAVQIAGEQVAVAPVIPVTATAEYAREMVQAELIQARRALQRRQRDLEDEERAAVFAVVQMLLEDGETVTFH